MRLYISIYAQYVMLIINIIDASALLKLHGRTTLMMHILNVATLAIRLHLGQEPKALTIIWRLKNVYVVRHFEKITFIALIVDPNRSCTANYVTFNWDSSSTEGINVGVNGVNERV